MKTSLGVWRFVGGGTYLQLLLFWSKSTQTFIHHPHSTYSSVSSTRPITLIRSLSSISIDIDPVMYYCRLRLVVASIILW